MRNILFIGMGNMGQAILKGLLKNNLLTPDNINFYEKNVEIIQKIEKEYGVTGSLGKPIKEYEMILIAVKPQVFKTLNNDETISKITKELSSDQTVVSIMAGIKIIDIQNFFNNTKKVIRVMPNTPALIGDAMSALCKSDETDKDAMDDVINIFNTIGKTIIVDEKDIDAVTGLSGSGPAYVFTFIEALIQGGILSGLNRKTAQVLAVQTVLGAAKMIDDETSIEDLRHMVTSPGGTTITGLQELELNGFRGTVSSAVYKAFQKSVDLGKN